jgi:hypothetical protein
MNEYLCDMYLKIYIVNSQNKLSFVIKWYRFIQCYCHLFITLPWPLNTCMQQRKQDNNCLNVFYKFLFEIAKTIAEQTDYVLNNYIYEMKNPKNPHCWNSFKIQYKKSRKRQNCYL